MNSRQKRILQQLTGIESWVKGKELAHIMGVTDRTIRSDIESINKTFPNLIESSTREGYRLENQVYETSKIEDQENIPQTPKERSIYIIKSLLFNQKKLKFRDLQEELFVSEHTIEGDIKKIREMVKPYAGLSLVREDNSLHFEGNEHIKRKLYRDLLTNEIQGNFLNLNKTATLYKKFDLLRVTSILEEVLESFQYEVRQTAIPMIIVHIGITIERMLSGNYLAYKDLNKEVLGTTEYDIAQTFFERILKIIQIEYHEEEVIGLATILMGYKNAYSLQEEIEYLGINHKVSFILEKVTENINETFNLDFSEDEDFKNGLHLHIQSLLNRVRNKVIIPNAHLQEVKRSYPMIFEMGLHIGQLIGDLFAFEISESEAGFIALHIGAAYDRLSQKHKYKVMLISPNNQSLSKLTKGKIQNMFKDRIEITQIAEYLIEEEVLSSDLDLIITVLNLEHKLDIPTIHISMFVSHEDESKIFAALNDLDKRRFSMEFSTQFSTLVDNRFFITSLDLETPEAVIRHLSELLEKENIVSPDFKDSVLERESMSSTSFAYSLAIPHPLKLESDHSKIAIAILNKPIKWGSYYVKLVMMPAITEEDSSKMWLFFDWLSETITNTEKMTKLMESKNRNEFVHWMLNN